MRRVILPFLVLILAVTAPLPAPSTAVVQAADPPVVQRITFTHEVDPGLSAQVSAFCGFPVEATVTGAVKIITRTTATGATRILQLQSYVATYTNPATGESVTLRAALQINETIAISPGAVVVTVSLQGLNFVHLQRDGTTVSAGQRDLTFTFGLDEQGNVTGPPQVTQADTPNFTGLAGFLCPQLAA